MTLLAGLDFGGTSVKVGLVDRGTGAVLARGKVPVRHDMAFETLAGEVADALDALCRERGQGPAAIGIATPGYADPDRGILVDGADNIPALARGGSLPEWFRARYGVPVTIDNDGTCAAIAELKFGAGRGLDRFVLLTLGTGIGGGVVIDGRPVLGRRRMPPELGALCLDPEGPLNYSGVPGTLERLASAATVVERYAAAGGGEAGAAAIFALAERGDAAAIVAVDGMARALAQACGIMTNLLNLDACLLGGGLSLAGSHALVQRIAGHLDRYTWPLLRRNVRIGLALLGNDAGLVGAATMAASPSWDPSPTT